MTDPTEAYRAAKAARAASEKTQEDETTRAETSLEQVEQKFTSIITGMKQSLPPELNLDAAITPTGLLGSQSVMGIFFLLIESGKIIAQGSFNCRFDEQVIMVGRPPDHDKRPKMELGSVDLESFDEQKAVSVLSQIIAQYLN